MIPLEPRLAEALGALSAFRERGTMAIRSRDLSRGHRERLRAAGYLGDVMKGWYVAIPPRPGGLSETLWREAFWPFCADYLTTRFGAQWCLAPEHSIAIHLGDWRVPDQLIVRAGRGGNKPTALPFGSAILDLRQPQDPADVELRGCGLRIMSLPAALLGSPAASYTERPRQMRAALLQLEELEALSARLLAGNHSRIAGRIAGAWRHLGRDDLADGLAALWHDAGQRIHEEDPFHADVQAWPPGRPASPYPNRPALRRLWARLRATTTQALSSAAGPAADASADPVDEPATHTTAGYARAFHAARESGTRIVGGQAPADVLAADLPGWFRAFDAPGVTLEPLRLDRLGGYRAGRRYPRGLVHRPPGPEALRDLLPVFFELIAGEADPAVRAQLAHLTFGYLQPFPRYNGLLGRLLLNVLLGAAGYAWISIPVERGEDYTAALQAAWVDGDGGPMNALLAGLAARPPAGAGDS